MDTRDDDAWDSKVDSLCAMFPNHAQSVLESILTTNYGNTESAANQLIDVNCANMDVQGLIQEETAVLANIKREMDQPPLGNGPTNPYNIVQAVNTVSGSGPTNPYIVQPVTTTAVIASALSAIDQNTYSKYDMFQPFGLQYQLGSEPERPVFLDTYQSFCAAQGYPCQKVPVVDFVNNINFDLYRMYTEVVKSGGYHNLNNSLTEREGNLLWKALIMRALKLKADKLALVSVKDYYKKYLVDFEIYYCGATSFSSIASASTSGNLNGQNAADNQNPANNAAAPPRNKHKKSRVSAVSAELDGASSSRVAQADSTTSHYLPVLNSGSSSSSVVPSNVPPAPNIPPSIPSNIPSNIFPSIPPMLLLSTAGIFDQSNGGGTLTSPYHTNGDVTSVLNQSIFQQGVEDAFQDVEDHHNQSFLDGDSTMTDDSRNDGDESEEEPQLPAAVLAARKVANEKLAKAEKELKETSVIFDLHPVDESDPEFDRLTDKAKIFFNLFSNSTVEITAIYSVQCPANRVHFFEKAANLTATSKTVELYKSSYLIPRHLLSEEKIYKILKEDIGGRLFSLYKYAKTEAEGNLTFVVCDTLLGENIDISDKVDMGDKEPNAFVVSYKNQIRLKYVVNLKATKIAAVRKSNPYSDVPDVLAHLDDGVWQVDVRTFDFRNASDPWCDVVMKATSLYNGDCVKRQALHTRGHKKEISHLEIVVSHGIWKKYDAQRQKIPSNGGKEIYAYHATSSHNVHSIAHDNLDWTRTPVHGRAHGDGCYFSEYPEFSLKYNRQCMFIFKLILLPKQYRRVKPDKQGYCEQIIMWDNSLFKPVYVLYF